MISSRPSEYFGWYFRYNTRTTYGHFQDAGIDMFASPAAQNQESWLDLTNVLPAVAGGFRRRWGLSQVATGINPVVVSPIRTVPYNQAQDLTNTSGTQDTNLLVYTDGSTVQALKDTGSSFTPYGSTLFGFVWQPNLKGVGALVSRQFLYYTNGTGGTIKSQLNVTGALTSTNWGITYPPSVSANQGSIQVTGWGSGSNYTGTQNVTFSDVGGTGSGAAADCIPANGHLQTFIISNEGTAYTQPIATLGAPGVGGKQAYAIAYTDLNSGNSTFGKVIAVLPAGPMAFVAGRTYTFALMNSSTGHVSDISSATATTPSNQALPALANVIFSEPAPYGSLGLPAQLGWTNVDVTITLPPNIDSQVDTVLLLATSDGGSLENLYLVASIPITNFGAFPHGGQSYTYSDTLPDTYSSMYSSGNTLLTNELYQSTDGAGGNFGIVGNTPPPYPLYFPTLHQGYIFGTDGKSLFFSKSIVDVTTANGLITSKWEEAWPGDNQLPISLGNETITALKSDGVNLHIGTTKSIYTCIGNDASNFSIPSQQFAQTGVLSNDLWSVVYSEGQPSGFMWVTPDYKVMWSDFNTYQDIGVPIYPLLKQWDSTFTNASKLLSFTSGPYNFVVLCYKRTTSAAAEFLIYETTLRKWYRWLFGSPTTFLQTSETGPLCSFVYQHPSTGTTYLYFFTLNSGVAQGSRIYAAPPTVPGGYTLNLYRFDPTQLADLGSQGIGWNIQTSWQYHDDPQVVKVLNEIDAITNESNILGTIYGAFTEADLDTPVTLVASQPFVTGILGNKKLYVAGAGTKARYYSYNFFCNNPSTTTDEVLTTFTTEHCPISRI